MRIALTLLLLILAPVISAQKGLLAPTPPMGWISWNLFEGNISESLVMQIADAMVDNGLRELGYEYIILDDLWQGGRDLWSHMDLGLFENEISLSVEPHQCRIIRFYK